MRTSVNVVKLEFAMCDGLGMCIGGTSLLVGCVLGKNLTVSHQRARSPLDLEVLHPSDNGPASGIPTHKNLDKLDQLCFHNYFLHQFLKHFEVLVHFQILA